MSLDRQKILNELGSVVNQLQSADCGCMGKLFSDSNGCQGGASMNPQGNYGMCRHSHCHNYGGVNTDHGNGYSSSCGGVPCARNMCFGQCNPPKLYADTYTYLNHNLMQPVVKEVYDDLKSITPENTIMNNPMGAKMGLPISGGSPVNGNVMQPNQMMASDMNNQMQNPMQADLQHNQTRTDMMFQVQDNGRLAQHQMHDGNMGYQTQQAMGDNAGIPQNQMHGSGMGNQMMQMTNQRISNQGLGREAGGMGPGIMKMMTSAASAARTPQSHSPGTMVPNAPQLTEQARAMPISAPGINPGQIMNSAVYQGQQYDNNADMNQGQYIAMNQGQYNDTAGNQKLYNIGMNSTNQQINNPVTQNMINSNVTGAFNPNAVHSINPNMQQGLGDNSFTKPVDHQMTSSNRNYGEHNQGMAKFNEMFPGVTNGDLGFDPMSIAIQMNPQNHQKAAMDQIQKLMNGNKHTSHMETAVSGANAARASMAKGKSSNINQQHNLPLVNQQESLSAPITQHQQEGINVPNQQMVAANTGALAYNKVQPIQQISPQQYQTPQQIVNHNAEAVATMPNKVLSEGASGDNNAQQYQEQTKLESPVEPDYGKMVIKEPIFPVDTSRFQTPLYMKRTKYYDYNTLGQPVEKLPANLYSQPIRENLPQTLSPQPVTKLRNDIARLINVKQTESKTSLVGNRPVGRVPSRSQMQHIYRQYKGSQSHTQQRVKSPSIVTYSERKLNVPQGNSEQVRQAPIEKVGGDTAANNNPTMITSMPEKGYPQRAEQIGDTLVDKPHGDSIPAPGPDMKKSRNGLQDQVYTAYPSSTAWSFHGNRNIPSSGYHYRRRY